MEQDALEALIAPLLEAEDAELVDLQFVHEGGRLVLKLFLDKEGGITLDDCAYFSDRVGALLDSKDAVSGSYVLEVSSPGLDRIIKKEKDFVRFAGQTVAVRLKNPREGRRNFKGRLLGFEKSVVNLEADGVAFQFSPEEIAEARLASEVVF